MGKLNRPVKKLNRKETQGIQCYWPCPCGGTVPNAPDNCPKRKRWSERAKVFCVDILICDQCELRMECPAMEEYEKIYPISKKHRN